MIGSRLTTTESETMRYSTDIVIIDLEATCPVEDEGGNNTVERSNIIESAPYGWTARVSASSMSSANSSDPMSIPSRRSSRS